MKIVGHCLVKDEERFIWYAINSVIDYLDEIMVWDTGSKDRTIEIIELIKNSNPKVTTKLLKVDEKEIQNVRQKMLDETNGDWIFILDGDEIWYEDGIKDLVTKIQDTKESFDLVVNPNYMLIGDLYHYQEYAAGRYKIGDRVGHFNIRALRNIPGLHIEGIYPDEAFVDPDGVKIQNYSQEKIYFSKYPYLHASLLRRTSLDVKKLKYEIGEEFASDFYYPEVFFKKKPDIVDAVWEPMSLDYKIRAFLETPLKKLRRRLI